MQCMQVQIPQPPRALVKHADDKQGGKRLCRLSPGHKQTQRRHSPNAVTIHATNALSQRENQDSSPLLSSPPLRRRQPRRRDEKEKSAALPHEKAQPRLSLPGALLYQNINFPEIRRHYATAAGGAQASPDYVPERRRCNQSSHLKVASPPPDKAAKVYVMNAPRTLAADGQLRAQPNPAHSLARAPRQPAARPGSGRGAGHRARAGGGRSAYRVPALRAASWGGGEKERGP